ICTPASARSRWVNEEVRYFKSLGRADRILAIIAGGEPNATDQPTNQEAECFAPALRFAVDHDGRLTGERAEPIAGDLRPGGDGWTNTFLKAVAGITGLGYNAFAQREVRRVTMLNGSGQAVNDSANHNASTEEISYRENGDLDAIRYANRGGREVFRETYGDMRNNDVGGKRHFVDFKLHYQDAPASLPKNFSMLGLSSSDQQNDATKSDITGEILDYSAEGRIPRD